KEAEAGGEGEDGVGSWWRRRRRCWSARFRLAQSSDGRSCSVAREGRRRRGGGCRQRVVEAQAVALRWHRERKKKTRGEAAARRRRRKKNKREGRR
ncbi:hypothetical protein Tsubulata_011382, partial [Turnera subulata]